MADTLKLTLQVVDPSVCLLSQATLDRLNLFRGDIVLLLASADEGGRTTALVVLSGEVADDVASVTEISLRNLGLSAGETVHLRLGEELPYAKKISLTPVDVHPDLVATLSEAKVFSDYAQPYFRDAYRPLTPGNLVRIEGTPPLELRVTACLPSRSVIVGPETVIYIEGCTLTKAAR